MAGRGKKGKKKKKKKISKEKEKQKKKIIKLKNIAKIIYISANRLVLALLRRMIGVDWSTTLAISGKKLIGVTKLTNL